MAAAARARARRDLREPPPAQGARGGSQGHRLLRLDLLARALVRASYPTSAMEGGVPAASSRTESVGLPVAAPPPPPGPPPPAAAESSTPAQSAARASLLVHKVQRL